jgi:hypothetical protein
MEASIGKAAHTLRWSHLGWDHHPSGPWVVHFSHFLRLRMWHSVPFYESTLQLMLLSPMMHAFCFSLPSSAPSTITSMWQFFLIYFPLVKYLDNIFQAYLLIPWCSPVRRDGVHRKTKYEQDTLQPHFFGGYMVLLTSHQHFSDQFGLIMQLTILESLCSMKLGRSNSGLWSWITNVILSELTHCSIYHEISFTGSSSEAPLCLDIFQIHFNLEVRSKPI